MRRAQTVTLYITYDDEETSQPGEWDWATLLDLDNKDDVTLVMATAPTKIEDNVESGDDESGNDECDCNDCLLERGEYQCDNCCIEIGNDEAHVHGNDYFCDRCHDRM